MLKLKQYLYLSAVFAFSFVLIPNVFAEDKKFDISGFARIVGGVIVNDSESLNGYDEEIKFGEESLFALQVNGKLSDKMSATAQFLYHPSEVRDSGIEWAYLTYHHNQKLNFKLGKMRTPFFQYSDVIDVGFSYPWITPPKQVYSEYIFSTFEGANVSYNFAGEQLAYYFEGYYGRFKDKISVNKNKTPTKIDNLRGVVGNIVANNVSFRLSYHKGYVEINEVLLNNFSETLTQLGFNRSAETLQTEGQVESMQASVNYENLNYFARFELMKLTSDIPFVQNSTGGYATLGYYFHPFTTHLTFASNKSDSPRPVNEIPTGLNPELDQLAYGYQDIFNSLLGTDKDSVTVGLKWDWKTNIALKLDMSFYDCDLPSSAALNENNAKTLKTNLMQVGLEWIF